MAVRVAIEGMHCGGCVNSVRNALTRAGLPPVKVEVGEAVIDVPGTDDAAITKAREAIQKAGFTATGITPEG
jgi:copper chaperone CopZ